MTNAPEPYSPASPNGQMTPSLSPVQAIKSTLSQYASFKGRARRSEFWWSTLAFNIFCVVAIIFDVLLNAQGVLISVAVFAILVPVLAVGARRLHDTGRSGWLLLLNVLPIVSLLLLVWWITDSKEDNKHGPNPKWATGN